MIQASKDWKIEKERKQAKLKELRQLRAQREKDKALRLGKV